MALFRNYEKAEIGEMPRGKKGKASESNKIMETIIILYSDFISILSSTLEYFISYFIILY